MLQRELLAAETSTDDKDVVEVDLLVLCLLEVLEEFLEDVLEDGVADEDPAFVLGSKLMRRSPPPGEGMGRRTESENTSSDPAQLTDVREETLEFRLPGRGGRAGVDSRRGFRLPVSGYELDNILWTGRLCGTRVSEADIFFSDIAGVSILFLR